ncbi:MAG: prolyl oligopeptidase family serine peptidase, partial [Afipia sp.]|nr:prolyl oligopeptidase family serine peptidase [Afipia sp.]
CCWEPAQDGLLGPLVAQRYHAAGWPRLVDRNNPYWDAISLVKNAQLVKLPMLFQLADTEFLGALESYTALSQAGNPVDMFIFPDEYHVKWRPAHRMAVYRRNLAWFDFWLKDQRPSDRAHRVEAERWSEMREKWQKAKQASQSSE